MSSILVPLDGSALAESVLPYVQQIAPVLSAGVQLLRVVSEAEKEVLLAHEDVLLAGGTPALSHRDREHEAWQTLIEHADRYLATQASRLRQAGLAVEVAAPIGHPAETIVDVAAERHSALIALATHGYGGLKRWMLGSVADKVVHAASAPVLVVRGAAAPRQQRIERVLVPLDGSALARQALPFAIDLAARAHAQIVLLEAIPPTIEAYPYVPLPTSIRDLLHEQALRELRGVAERLRQQDLPATWMVRDGNAAEAIVDTAARQRIDLLVMATHGYSGIRRWALGSVADKVLHASPAPLVLIRARQIAEG